MKSRTIERDWTTAMICICDKCKYTFQSNALPDRCPDCGAATVENCHGVGKDRSVDLTPAVRKATTQEIVEYENLRLTLAAEW